MKLINTKYQTPPPHQFFASGRFDVIAADVSFRDIERRGEWNGRGRGKREEGRGRVCVRVCRDPVRVDHHSSEGHLRGRAVSADSKTVSRETALKIATPDL